MMTIATAAAASRVLKQLEGRDPATVDDAVVTAAYRLAHEAGRALQLSPMTLLPGEWFEHASAMIDGGARW